MLGTIKKRRVLKSSSIALKKSATKGLIRKTRGGLGVSGSDAQLHGLEHKTAGRTVAVQKDPEEDRGSGTHDHIPFASASGAASSGDPITVPPSPPGDADSNDGWWPWVHRRCRKSRGICYRADVPPRCCAKLPRGKTQ